MVIHRTISDALKEIEPFLRLQTFENEGVKKALISILHNKNKDPSYDGLPESPLDLCKQLKKHEKILGNLKKWKVLKKEQLDLLLPKSGEVFSKDLDIGTLTVVIQYCTNLPVPKDGWNKKPQDDDESISAFVCRAREWRNRLQHEISAMNISQDLFDKTWDEGCCIVDGLNFSFDHVKLKGIPLDPRHEPVLNAIMPNLAKLSSDMFHLKGELGNFTREEDARKYWDDFHIRLEALKDEIEILKQNQYHSSAGIYYYLK